MNISVYDPSRAINDCNVQGFFPPLRTNFPFLGVPLPSLSMHVYIMRFSLIKVLNGKSKSRKLMEEERETHRLFV